MIWLPSEKRGPASYTDVAFDRRTPEFEDIFRRSEQKIMIDKELKQQVIDEYKMHGADTGSPEVQVAILTTRIRQLTEHMKIHKKDFHSRRGLLIMVSKRRKLLHYLKDRSFGRYQDLIKRLGLRH